MAAPSTTDRGTPEGIPLRDGHPTKITFAADSTVELWEKTVTPPGIDGGDPVEATTMHNVTWRVMRPRTLKTLTECSFTCAYDPEIYTTILSLINNEDTITITFSDGSQVAFYGYLRSFEADEVEDGEQPTATVVIQPTNWDATNSVEAGPTVEETAGT